MSAVDPTDVAQGELAAAMVPTPDDLLAEVGPLAALYYLEQVGWHTLRLFAAFATEQAEAGAPGDADLAITLNQLAATVGGLDALCARIGLIPPEAVPSDV